MNLQITQLSNSLKNVRLAPHSDTLESPTSSRVFPGFCMCANRYGAPLSSVEGNAEHRTVRGNNSAYFAALGR